MGFRRCIRDMAIAVVVAGFMVWCWSSIMAIHDIEMETRRMESVVFADGPTDGYVGHSDNGAAEGEFNVE